MNTTRRKLDAKYIADAINAFDMRGIKSCPRLSLKLHSTFAIGGCCALAVFPENAEELVFALEQAQKYEMEYEVIGRASNILFSDDGYEGMIIFTSQMRQIFSKGKNCILADAGANLTSLSVKAAGWGLSGLEFACGIPGSCAGAVYMNAGAYGGEISEILEYSEYYDTVNKRFGILHNTEHNFSYRYSIYQDRKEMIITGACFKLACAPVDDIRATMDEYTRKRRSSQPHEYPNAGSIFKRPKGGFAAKMIDECGLKGLTVGGAQVSEKHAGFIVNKGNASSDDVLRLIEIVKERVYKSFGTELECEIRIIKQ